MELLALIVVVVIVAIYYGMGKNLEVSSRMLTRELEDAERSQKTRIVKAYGKKAKEKVTDEEFTAATAEITRIDDLDI